MGYAAPMAEAFLSVGTRVADRYRITGLIARGGMGAVHDAVDERLGRDVALKVLRGELVEDRTLVARFEREARTAARLAHPGIAQVLDFGTTDRGLLYLVMERVRGETLGALLSREGRLAPARAAELVEQALGALASAHAAGIVHRDLKPGNLMVVPTGESREVLKVFDFGIAHLMDGEAYTRLTQTGLVLGTPSFMAPEQARGERVDARADLYAMGVVLFCLLTGRKPFEAANVADVVEAVLHTVPPRADAIVAEVPSELADIASMAMHKDPARRHPDVNAMGRALVAYRQRASSGAVPQPVAPDVPVVPMPLAPSSVAAEPAPALREAPGVWQGAPPPSAARPQVTVMAAGVREGSPRWFYPALVAGVAIPLAVVALAVGGIALRVVSASSSAPRFAPTAPGTPSGPASGDGSTCARAQRCCLAWCDAFGALNQAGCLGIQGETACSMIRDSYRAQLVSAGHDASACE